MDVSALRLRRFHTFGTLAPLAQWSLLETAFQQLRAPAASRFVPVVYIMAAYALTGELWCMGWLLVALGGLAVGRHAAKRFDMRASDADATLCARRFANAVWIQAACLGVGGLGAAWGGNPATALLVACPIGFALMEACATAILAPVVRAQTILMCVPFMASCLVQGALWQGSVYHAVIGAFMALWAAGSLPLANMTAARMKSVAQAAAEGSRAQSSLSGPLALPPAARDFQKLLGRDQVTGLPNRHSFVHLLAQEGERAYRAEAPLSLVLVGWDEFEPAAARWTQSEIDDMVSDIAKRLRAKLRRPTDVLASLGDGRFGILLPSTDAFGATVVARNLHQVLSTPDQQDGRPAAVSVAVSIGTATYRGKGLLPEGQMLEFAEQALRDARYTGGNRIRSYDPIANTLRPAPYRGPLPKERAPVAKLADSRTAEKIEPDVPVINTAALGAELRH